MSDVALRILAVLHREIEKRGGNPADLKFNPYHDEQGRFTSGGGGGMGGGSGGGGNFGSVQSPGEWGATNFTNWQEGLSSDEEKSITAYTGGKYALINAHLRELPGYTLDDLDDKIIGTINKHIGNLDNAISRSIVPDNITVYRKLGNQTIDKLQEGGEFIDKGYGSTSLESNYINQHYKGHTAEIRIPKGTHAAYFGFEDDLLGFTKEQELLLPRNTRYKVINKTDNGIILEVLSNG